MALEQGPALNWMGNWFSSQCRVSEANRAIGWLNLYQTHYLIRYLCFIMWYPTYIHIFNFVKYLTLVIHSSSPFCCWVLISFDLSGWWWPHNTSHYTLCHTRAGHSLWLWRCYLRGVQTLIQMWLGDSGLVSRYRGPGTEAALSRYRNSTHRTFTLNGIS